MAPYNPNRNDPFLDVRRLRVRPGDVVIVRFPERVPDSYVQSALEIMKKRLVQAGHPTTPVLIAQGGATVEVLGHEERETVQGTDGPVEVFRLDDATVERHREQFDLKAVVGWRMRTAHNPKGWRLVEHKPDKGDRYGRDGWFVEPLGVLPFRSQPTAASPDLRTFADPVGLPADVVALVRAARAVAFDEAAGADKIKALDKASEAFADRVPWDDAP